MPRVSYYRILALASIDVVLTLPIGITTIVIFVTSSEYHFGGKFPFYSGWTAVHSDWAPAGTSWTDFMAMGTARIAQAYLTKWSSLVISFAIFGLFGMTTEARASYRRILCATGGRFGWKLTPRAHERSSMLAAMEFSEQTEHPSIDPEIG